MASVILKLVVGKDPHSATYGFSISTKNDYGTVIPDKVDGVLLGDFTFAEAGTITLNVPTPVFGTDGATLTTASGEVLDLLWNGTAYTADSVAIGGGIADREDELVELSLVDHVIVPLVAPEPMPKKKKKKKTDEG